MRVALLFLVGCAAERTLGEVSISGGTPAQQAEVRAALEEFDAFAGAGRVRLRSIRIRAMREVSDEGLLGGRYLHGRRRIVLNDAQDAFRDVVWHELCHALERDEDLTAGDPVITRVEEGLFDPAYHASPLNFGVGRYRNEERRRSETLATFCGVGPYGAAVVARDPEAPANEIAQWLLDHVWTEFELEEQALADLPAVAWKTDLTTQDPEIRPTEDAGTIAIVAGFSTERREGRADLATGEPVARRAEPRAVSTRVDGRPLATTYVYGSQPLAGFEGGGGALLAGWDFRHLGSPGGYLLVTDGDGAWRYVPGDAHRERALFTADDRVWVGWRDAGGTLWWAPLADR